MKKKKPIAEEVKKTTDTKSSNHHRNSDQARTSSSGHKLYTIKEVPLYLRFNPNIITGYRKNLSITQCIASLFRLHNQSVNIWTHLLAFFMYFGLSIHTLLSAMPRTHKYVFLVLTTTSQYGFLSSTVYHTFLCHSEKFCTSALRFDYSGLSAIIVGTFYPPLFYAFYCFPFERNLYLMIETAMGICGILGPLFVFFHQVLS